jgi:uncharacterized protein (TIGR00730 family)
MKSLCIYCASSEDVDERYKQAAYEVGRLCALNGWRLITGAGSEGLMGAAYRGCHDAGGTVAGVIPHWMVDRGWLQEGLDEPVIVSDMNERKQWFRDHCDAALVLPGGYGTMEEFFETITRKQLGLFSKPIAVLNYDHFYDKLLDWLRQCWEERFLRHDTDIELLGVIQEPEELFPLLEGK